MKKIALVVGHKASAQGASNLDGTTEFQFNDEQCRITAEKLVEAGFEPVIVYRHTYSELPHKINKLNPDLIISFHCNAFDRKVSGSEVLHYDTSKNGKRLAEILQRNTVSLLDINDRGAKGINTGHEGRAGDRGGLLVRYTHAPCVIWEPFFIDNDSDLSLALDYRDELAGVVVATVEEYFNA